MTNEILIHVLFSYLEQPGVIHSYEVPVNADPQAILGACNPNLIFTQGLRL